MMMKRRYLAIALLTLTGMALSAVIGTGCAYRRADRSLVQPLALSKKQFTGEWYYMKTIYEAPYESGFFNGQGGWPLGSKIRWEVTERFLYAFNASPNIRDTGSEVTPTAAWPITKHFDVKPSINYSTGEPSNVIVEESSDGTPWYQRRYMRVMWERMVISDFTDIFTTYYTWIGYIRMEPANFVPPQKVEMAEKYMTFVSEDLITKLFDSYYNMATLEIPMSSYRVKIRHSFKKVEPSTYQPKEYNDYMFAKFGNFRTTILRYHPDRGIVDWSYKFYANRHNIANKEEVAKYDAEKTPQAQQKPRKITYHLSPNFPDDMRPEADKVANAWNEAFAHATQRPAKDEKGNNALFEVLPNDHGLAKGQRRELGDLRYNYIWFVNEPQDAGLLGYGPSLADPDTGEIVHASAYIYAPPMRQITDQYMTLYDMITGRYKESDILNSVEYFNAAFNLNQNRPLSLPTGSKQANITNITLTGPRASHLNSSLKIGEYIQQPEYLTRMGQIQKLDNSFITAQIAKLDDHPQAKATLLSDEAVQLAFPGIDTAQILASTDPLVKKALERYHPVEMTKPSRLREMMETFIAPSRVNMYMARYYNDAALKSFFEYHQKKGTSREELRKRIMGFLFVSVTAHEVGHTLGLTHNFTGSTDEYNYQSPYHDLAKDGKVNCKDGDPRCPEDMRGNQADKESLQFAKFFYRSASIMDYAGEYYDDTIGVGKTDRAAIAFIYNSLVEKAVSDPREQGEMIKWSMDVDRRNQNPNDPLKLRPFRFCSDYMVGQDPLCQRFDSGPSAKDIVQNVIWNYDRTYLLRYWRRGQRGFNPWGSISRNFFGFQHIASIYQDWSYRILTQPGYKKTQDFQDKLEAIQTGYNFFMRILATPEVDQHTFDKQTGMWMRSPTSPDEYRPKIDITLGAGRFFYSSIMDGYYGIFRFQRTGTLYDKWLTMMSMSIRSWGYYNNSVNWLYTNFYDLFRQDTTEFFSQGISDVWQPKSKLLFVAKAKEDGKDIEAPIEPAWHPFLQYNSMVYALALLNNQFADQTFGDYMRVGIVGSGKSWLPPGQKEVTCPEISDITQHYKCNPSPVLCFMNSQKTRTYFGVQTNDQSGISWQMVRRGCEIAQDLALLRRTAADVNRAEIERKESDLRMVETVLTYMQWYVSIFGG